jgi:hypothetical protein
MNDVKIDWHSHPLTASLKIDANYKNTQNVRRFFKSQLGEHFKFDRSFMKWMLDNNGKTLADA